MINSNLEPPPVEVRETSYPALDSLLAQAERRLEAAQDDSEWVEAFLAWLELHRLKFGPDLEESET